MGFARHRRVSRLPATEGQIKYLFSKPSARSRISWPAKHTTSVGETYEGTISGRGALYTGECRARKRRRCSFSLRIGCDSVAHRNLEVHAGRGGRDTAACRPQPVHVLDVSRFHQAAHPQFYRPHSPPNLVASRPPPHFTTPLTHP